CCARSPCGSPPPRWSSSPCSRSFWSTCTISPASTRASHSSGSASCCWASAGSTSASCSHAFREPARPRPESLRRGSRRPAGGWPAGGRGGAGHVKAGFQFPRARAPCRDIAPPQRRCFCARLGGRNSVRRRWALYSNLRFVASASLVALASVVGVLALYPDALEELLVASAEISDPPAACQQQDWWQLDRSCLSRRGMPWVAASPESNAVAFQPAAEGAPEQLSTKTKPAASAPAQRTQQNEATAPQQETPALPPVAEERQIPTQRSEVAASPQETPAPPPLAEEQNIG